MFKNLDFTQAGVLKVYQDTFMIMQEGYSGSLDGLAAGLGDKIVLSGCEDTGSDVADGWVVINGEIMPFVGASLPLTPMVKVETTVTKAAYNDGLLRDFYTYKRATLVSVGDFNYSELKRLPGGKGLFQTMLDMQQVIKRIANLDDAVILNGCEVSSVNTGDSTCDIAAGEVLINGVLFHVPANPGATYPIYITEDGSWNNSLPSAPFIKFDPYTSQRYVDVVKRNTTPAGQIVIFETLSDRFVAGVGKWEMKGFSLVAALQSRTPKGLWFDGIAVTNVTDANHTTAGNTGGEKEHAITVAEMPAHKHFTVVNKSVSDGNFPASRGTAPTSLRAMIKSWFKTTSGAEGYELDGDTDAPTISPSSSSGGTDKLKLEDPYVIVVYAKRTA